MEIIRIQDRYNLNKIWIVKRSKCYHYYINQENSGYKLNKEFNQLIFMKKRGKYG